MQNDNVCFLIFKSEQKSQHMIHWTSLAMVPIFMA